jgi:branched-chain amino acid transport system ATP-binding protein
VFACFGLALANRFLVYALFGGELLHLTGFLIDFAVITVLALLAYRLTVVHKMVSQYPWRYERESLFTYREKAGQA